MVILCFCTNSETDVRRCNFVYLLCPFVRGLFTTVVRPLWVCLHVTPCVNPMWLFCVFIKIAKQTSVAVFLFTCCVHSLEVCLLLLSVRYGFVYMFTPCVNLLWLFCVFVPITKRTSVAVFLFTCCVHSLEVCLLLLSVRYGFV